MKFTKIVFLLIVLIITNSVRSQSGAEKKLLKKARKSLAEANYDLAKKQYEDLIALNPQESLYHFETGVTYFNSYYQREKALPHFENALKASTKDTISEIFFYLGKTHHYIGNYQLAINYYQQFKSYIIDNDDGTYVTTRVDVFIKMCTNALELQKEEQKTKSNIEIRKLNQNVNSSYAEYGSVTNRDGSVMLFTTRDRENIGKQYYFDSKKHEDIYVSFAQDTSWQKRTKVDLSKTLFSAAINTKKHDAVIGFSANDDKLFIYRNNGIWYCELNNGKYGEPIEMVDINTKGHEPSSFISRDGKTLYFTSNKYDSKGGRDIFITTLGSDGKWTTPKNLGPNINTEADEDAPFITADGKTMFFSSNGRNTIGGYDVFKSELDENGNWGPAINIGTQINSPADDIFYTQDSLAESAYLSSGRAYGYGDMDIYRISLLCKNIPHTEIRGLVVMGDDYAPVKSTITAFNEKTNEKVGTFHTDPKTGKYLMILPPDNNYYLDVVIEGMEVERPFRDKISLPRQCEYYQMFQHIQLNKVKEGNDVVAYEAVFDNAMLDVKKTVEKTYNLPDVKDALHAHFPIAKDSSFVIEGQICHNDILHVVNSKVMLVNKKGEIIRTGITSNEGKFRFPMLSPEETYTVLIDEEDAKISYYGNNPSNSSNNVIAKGHIDWKKVDGNNVILSTMPLDSVDVLFVKHNLTSLNRALTDLKGDFILDNIIDPSLLPKTYTYNLQMTDEDLLYKAMLHEDSVKNNELYTIIKDIVRLTKIEKPDNIVAFEPIYFDFDKFFLRLESKEILEKILAFMNSDPQSSIEIKGHTDWMGTDSYNIQLSQRRSESAFNYLASSGVSKDRLTMKWFGESQPAVSNKNPDGSDNEENRQLNRRCEFTITAANGLAYVIVLE